MKKNKWKTSTRNWCIQQISELQRGKSKIIFLQKVLTVVRNTAMECKTIILMPYKDNRSLTSHLYPMYRPALLDDYKRHGKWWNHHSWKSLSKDKQAPIIHHEVVENLAYRSLYCCCNTVSYTHLTLPTKA